MKNLVKLCTCISELLGFDVPLHPVPIQFISLLKGKPVEYATPAVRMMYGDPVGDPEQVLASFSSAMI